MMILNGSKKYHFSVWLKTKKPAAGGGAAGFSEKTEQQLGGGVLLFLQTILGGGVDRLNLEALLEEVHCFDENDHTYFLMNSY